MTVPIEDVWSAAELVAFGLRTGARPTDGNAYGQLLERYRTNTAFRDAVDTVAGGLGLVVLGAPARTGLVLSTQPGSVFALRMADLRGGAWRPTTSSSPVWSCWASRRTPSRTTSTSTAPT